MAVKAPPELAPGTLWRRDPPGREVVRVGRVWDWGRGLTVRAHPVRGGKPLIADAAWFCEHYTPEG